MLQILYIIVITVFLIVFCALILAADHASETGTAPREHERDTATWD